MRQRRVGLVLLCFGSMGIAAAQERAAISSSLAKQYFAEAAALSDLAVLRVNDQLGLVPLGELPRLLDRRSLRRVPA